MKFKTRLDNILAKLANKEGARDIKLKTKDETLLAAINDMVEPFVVVFSGTTSGSNAECDKTWSEIKAAIEAGRHIAPQYKVSTTLGSTTNYYYLYLSTKTHGIATQGSDGVVNSMSAFGVDIGSVSGSSLPVKFVDCNIDEDRVTIVVSNASISV